MLTCHWFFCIFKRNKPYPRTIVQSQHNNEVREEGDCKSVSFAISVSLVSSEVAPVTKTGVRIFSVRCVNTSGVPSRQQAFTQGEPEAHKSSNI